MANYDIIGDIAIMHFPDKIKKSEKLKQAKQLLKRANVKTVLEKQDRIKGRLRTIKTKHILGDKPFVTFDLPDMTPGELVDGYTSMEYRQNPDNFQEARAKLTVDNVLSIVEKLQKDSMKNF